MFKGMVGSTLGIWVAHGEGGFASLTWLMEEVRAKKLVPVVFVDDEGRVTGRFRKAILSIRTVHLSAWQGSVRRMDGIWR